VQPAGPDERTYALSQLAIVYPFTGADGDPDTHAGVSFVSTWTTAANPGTVLCRIVLRGTGDAVVGDSTFQLTSNTSRPTPFGPIDVPVDGAPAGGEAFCEKAAPVDPDAGYEFSELRVEGDALVGTIRWSNGDRPGEQLCRAEFSTSDGAHQTLPFTIAQAEGTDQPIVLLPSGYGDSDPTSVSCEALAGEPDET
jgi:hypothetical protein